MIFVTVGTHEQQFNRLIRAVDQCRLDEEVFMQIGYGDYLPINCQYKRLISQQEMKYYVKEARIILTHGGPGSIISALQAGKVPIVVPRQYKYGEHVNDHQIKFSNRLKSKNEIIEIVDISELDNVIRNYDTLTSEMSEKFVSNNKRFVDLFEEQVSLLMRK